MSILTELLFVVAILLYHEAGHFAASEYYGVTQAVVLYRSKHRIGRWLLWGPAIQMDSDGLTKRQRLTCLLAPLVWVPIGLVVGGLYLIVPDGLFVIGMVVMVGAGLVTLLSDVPMYKWGSLKRGDFDVYTLWEAT